MYDQIDIALLKTSKLRFFLVKVLKFELKIRQGLQTKEKVISCHWKLLFKTRKTIKKIKKIFGNSLRDYENCPHLILG